MLRRVCFVRPTATVAMSAVALQNQGGNTSSTSCVVTLPSASAITRSIPSSASAISQSVRFQITRAGDWLCPNCFMNNALTKETCVKCRLQKEGTIPERERAKEAAKIAAVAAAEKAAAEKKEAGGKGGRPPRAFDWDCAFCGFTNFASRGQCTKCDKVRPESERQFSNAKNKYGADDWSCPKCNASNHVNRPDCCGCSAPNPW